MAVTARCSPFNCCRDRLKQLSASQLHPSHGSFPFVSSSVPTTTDPLHPPLRFHSFGYDWRRSLQLSSALLLEKLQRLKEESALRGEGPDGKGLGATIIAHSVRLSSQTPGNTLDLCATFPDGRSRCAACARVSARPDHCARHPLCRNAVPRLHQHARSASSRRRRRFQPEDWQS